MSLQRWILLFSRELIWKSNLFYNWIMISGHDDEFCLQGNIFTRGNTSPIIAQSSQHKLTQTSTDNHLLLSKSLVSWFTWSYPLWHLSKGFPEGLYLSGITFKLCQIWQIALVWHDLAVKVDSLHSVVKTWFCEEKVLWQTKGDILNICSMIFTT